MVRGERDTKCPSGWTSLSVSSGRWDKKCFSFRLPLYELSVHITLALEIHVETKDPTVSPSWGCQSLETPSPMISTNFLSLFIFFWLCFITIISRTMHFLCINYIIWNKRPPVTDLDFKAGSLWPQVSDCGVSTTAQADVILPLQCPLHLPIT